jgi:predicted O-methyltransferase YrrM
MFYQSFHEKYSSIPGFSYQESFAIWDFLLNLQHEFRVGGDLMEIGVYYGKSAALLAMHAQKEEEIFLVDFTDFVDHAKTTVEKIKCEKVSVLKVKSSDPHIWKLANTRARSLRWIHIDGDHKAETVQNDLLLAIALLNDDGIICVDDFFNSRYPGLTYAVCIFLEQHRNELQMFLCGFNKVYLVRPIQLHRHLHAVRDKLGDWLAKLGLNDFTIYKTDLPGAVNCFGIGARWEKYVYYGLDEDPELIVY